VPVQPGNQIDRTIYLRSQLCEYLIDIPAIINESSILLMAAKDPLGAYGFRPRIVSLKARVTSLKQNLETWFVRDVEPGLFAIPSSEVAEEERSVEYSGPGLLPPVLDCVVNSALLMLEKMDFGLECLQGTPFVGADFPSVDYLRRRRRAEAAYAYVKARSTVCAKPLELGLQQLSAGEDVLDALWNPGAAEVQWSN
jgi:hypothetical protein